MRISRFLLLIVLIFALYSCKGKEDIPEAATPEAAIPEVQSEQSAVAEVEIPQAPAAIAEPKKPVAPVEQEQKKEGYKVTFLEIGSVNCIPCKMMQPIMKDIAEEYKGIVKVEFHDLGEDREIGQKYRIRVMPTQVFLDANGQEFFRHEGFYPKAELSKMLDAHLAKR